MIRRQVSTLLDYTSFVFFTQNDRTKIYINDMTLVFPCGWDVLYECDVYVSSYVCVWVVLLCVCYLYIRKKKYTYMNQSVNQQVVS